MSETVQDLMVRAGRNMAHAATTIELQARLLAAHGSPEPAEMAEIRKALCNALREDAYVIAVQYDVPTLTLAEPRASL